LSQRDRLPSAAESGEGTPTIDLLAATGSGAPNVVRLELARVEVQPFKELDDNYVGMHLKLAQDLIYGRGEHQTTGIVLQLHRTEDMEVARARLLLLFKTHHLDLEIRDFTDLTPQYTQITALFRSIFSFIILIIAIVALFTVSNAMSMSVIERTAEIGTIRAMGVRRQGIRRQFLVEGSLLGVVGATVGVLVGYAVAYGVNHLQLSWTPPGAAAPVPLRLYMAGAYLLILVTWVGLVFTSALAASIPASRAARMPVVDALRHV
jgi:putative ABC transport system permease protein